MTADEVKLLTHDDSAFPHGLCGARVRTPLGIGFVQQWEQSLSPSGGRLRIVVRFPHVGNMVADFEAEEIEMLAGSSAG